jgi:hypothetical protein
VVGSEVAFGDDDDNGVGMREVCGNTRGVGDIQVYVNSFVDDLEGTSGDGVR